MFAPFARLTKKSTGKRHTSRYPAEPRKNFPGSQITGICDVLRVGLSEKIKS